LCVGVGGGGGGCCICVCLCPLKRIHEIRGAY